MFAQAPPSTRSSLAEGVEQFALAARAQHRLRRVLAVDVDQHFADFPQLGDGGGVAVDQRPRTAVGFDDPAQHDGAWIARQLADLEPGLERVVGHEFSDQIGARRAFANHAGIAARAQRELQRIDQDGFAGAGFTGEDGEAGSEFDFQRIDDDEVTQAQGEQHGCNAIQAGGRDRIGISCQLSLPRKVAKWL